MKYFAQFFTRSAIDQNKIVEACGDRGVIILDGRMSKQSMGEVAAQECAKRGYVAWQVHQGNFRLSKPISQVWYVSKGPADNTSMAAAYGA